jgi:hypothetical protein
MNSFSFYGRFYNLYTFLGLRITIHELNGGKTIFLISYIPNRCKISEDI